MGWQNNQKLYARVDLNLHILVQGGLIKISKHITGTLNVLISSIYNWKHIETLENEDKLNINREKMKKPFWTSTKRDSGWYNIRGRRKATCNRNIKLSAMMTSTNGNIFRFTGILCGEFTGHRWIPRTKFSDAELWCSSWSAPEPTVEQTMETQVIWDAIAPIMTSL